MKTHTVCLTHSQQGRIMQLTWHQDLIPCLFLSLRKRTCAMGQGKNRVPQQLAASSKNSCDCQADIIKKQNWGAIVFRDYEILTKSVKAFFKGLLKSCIVWGVWGRVCVWETDKSAGVSQGSEMSGWEGLVYVKYRVMSCVCKLWLPWESIWERTVIASEVFWVLIELSGSLIIQPQGCNQGPPWVGLPSPSLPSPSILGAPVMSPCC